MMKLISVVLVMFFAAASASAVTVQLPLVNGDFEAGDPHPWSTTPPTGWVNGTGNNNICENGGTEGAKMMQMDLPSGGGTAQLLQYTSHTIQNSYTYTLSMDDNEPSNTVFAGTLLMAICAIDADDNLTQVAGLGFSSARDDAWHTRSVSYTADATHAGKTIMVYFAFQNGTYAQADNVRLIERTHHLVVSSEAFTAFENTLSGTNQASYTVQLDGIPASNVTVNMTSSDPNVTLSDSSLTFTDTDWNLPQPVTATVDNRTTNTTISREAVITNTTSSSDPEYDDLAEVEVAITIYNDDVAGVYCNIGDGLVVDEEGETSDTYTAQLLMPPSDTVIVSPVAGDPAAISLSTPFSFTVGQWYEIETVTVTAIDDSVEQNGNHITYISHLITSADEDYSEVEPSPIYVNIHDNDCGAWGTVTMDLNGDCIVNVEDFAIVGEEWMDCTIPHGEGCHDAR